MTSLKEKLELFREKFRPIDFCHTGENKMQYVEYVRDDMELFLSQTVKELLEEMVVGSRELGQSAPPGLDEKLETFKEGYNSARQDQLERLKKILG